VEDATFSMRRERIRAWISLNPISIPTRSVDCMEIEIAKAVAAYESACAAIRASLRAAV
jgi:hypothetical protein